MGAFSTAFGEWNGDLTKRLFKNVTELNRSGSTPLYGYPHGTCVTPYGFMISTRTNPAKIILFTDENNLSSYVETTVTGQRNIDTMVYDSINNVCYALVNTYASTSTIKIIQINPETLAYTTVYTNGSLVVGSSPTICTDGIHIYGGTYGGGGKLFKIRISDWTLISTVTTPTSGFHASVLQTYTDRIEMYITNSTEYMMYKVNCDDMSYTTIYMPSLRGTPDDMVFTYINNNGGYLYVGAESNNIIAKIDTAAMSAEYFPGKSTYGLFSNGTDLYSVGYYIVKYPNFDLNIPITNKTYNPAWSANEMFFGTNGKLFYTEWVGTSKLVEFQMTL